MGIFSGSGTAAGRGDINYIRPCHILARLDKAHIVDNCRDKVDLAAIDFTVLHDLASPDGDHSHSIGEEVNWGLKVNNDYFGDETQRIAIALGGWEKEGGDPAECDKMLDEIFGPDNPLGGVVVEIYARNVVTTKGGDFTKITFRRALSSAEALEALPEETVERFFPDQQLQKLAEAEAAAA